MLAGVGRAGAEILRPSDTASLTRALRKAAAGDTIEIRPGTYALKRQWLRRNGTAAAPIMITAAKRGSVTLQSHSVELLKISGRYWVVDGIEFVGDANTFHAIHITGDADNVIIRNNRFRDFHAAIKANGEGTPAKFPDNVVIANNVFSNSGPRRTSAPVNTVNIDGGTGWRIVGNMITDFEKQGGNDVSYGAFLKGSAENGLIARNLVICEWRHRGGQRIGLSLGGGGFAKRTTPWETRASRIVNNIVLNCPEGPAIYINKGAESVVAFNTIYNAFGIDARFPETSATVANNVMTGSILDRDGATVAMAGNLAAGTALGYYLPSLKRSLVLRISDYDKKFPSLLDAGDIRWAQGVIRGALDWLARGRLGMGLARLDDLFRAPEVLDFSAPNGAELINASVPDARVQTDFCGQKRLPPADLGAIEYEAGGCAILEVLRSRYGPFLRPGGRATLDPGS